jgi:hypothetical protein
MANDDLPGSKRSLGLDNLVRDAAQDVQAERIRFYQEFLLAKAQRREGNPISDKMAEAMAVIGTNDDLTIAEAEFRIMLNAMEKQG